MQANEGEKESDSFIRFDNADPPAPSNSIFLLMFQSKLEL